MKWFKKLFKLRTTVKFPNGCDLKIILDESIGDDEFILIMHPKNLPSNLTHQTKNR